jgi:hypothetical protein
MIGAKTLKLEHEQIDRELIELDTIIHSSNIITQILFMF